MLLLLLSALAAIFVCGRVVRFPGCGVCAPHICTTHKQSIQLPAPNPFFRSHTSVAHRVSVRRFSSLAVLARPPLPIEMSLAAASEGLLSLQKQQEQQLQHTDGHGPSQPPGMQELVAAATPTTPLPTGLLR